MTQNPPISWPYRSYTLIFQERLERLKKIQSDSILVKGAKIYYFDKPTEFINDWLVTYDPRNSGKGLPTIMPFITFPIQDELILYLMDCLRNDECGLIEKSRDMGATWICCAVSIWLFLFSPGVSIGWGSRKEQLVDKLGDPDSIFEKLRLLLKYTPKFFLPPDFDMDKHCSYMKIINPQNGATITGEAGDNIGRGGRKSIYFKDESAHYERPEKIEAALGENTNVQIDFSSVNGMGNIFYRRRIHGQLWTKNHEIPDSVVRVFILDWRDHPLKTQEWYDKRRAKAEREGLLHLFSQEVDRDYSSAVEGILIPAAWVKAAIDLDKRFQWKGEIATGKHYLALDPFDEGADAHAAIARRGPLITYGEVWSKGDTGDAARKCVLTCKMKKINSFQYESTGIGAGVKTETNRLAREKLLPENLHIQKWNPSGKVLRPADNIIEGDKESPKNRDFYKNISSQAAWNLRLRFERTHKYVNKGEEYGYSDLISISSDLECFDKLCSELSQPIYKPDSSGKIMIEKKPPGTKSPNLFDACKMAFWPADPVFSGVIVGAPTGIKNERQHVVG